jgi:hypothetical protein
VETATQFEIQKTGITDVLTLINYIVRSGETDFLIYVDIAGLSNGWKIVREMVGKRR